MHDRLKLDLLSAELQIFRSYAKSFDEDFRSADFQESAGWHLRSRHNHHPIEQQVLVGADGITKLAGATFQLAKRRDSGGFYYVYEQGCASQRNAQVWGRFGHNCVKCTKPASDDCTSDCQ